MVKYSQKCDRVSVRVRRSDMNEISKLADLCGVSSETYIREIIEVFVAEKGGRLDSSNVEKGRCRTCPLQGSRELSKAGSGGRLFDRRQREAGLSLLPSGCDRPADVRDRLG